MAGRDYYELQCFVSQLSSLCSAGKSACLTVECRNFELSINLHLNLPGLVHPRPGPRRRPSPYRLRRHARRAAAAADKAVQRDLPVHKRADAAVQADQCVPSPPSKPTQPPAMPTNLVNSIQYSAHYLVNTVQYYLYYLVTPVQCYPFYLVKYYAYYLVNPVQ